MRKNNLDVQRDFITNKRQDYKIGKMCVGNTFGKGEDEQRTLRWGNMIDGFHILIWTRTKKPLAIALSGLVWNLGWETVGVIYQFTIQAYLEFSQWISLIQWIYPNKY
jgi:hypothetical protein